MDIDLLKTLKSNEIIYGKGIQEIESATDKYYIRYFEKVLSRLLNFDIKINPKYSKYFNISYGGGRGDIESIKLNKNGFGLTKEQCIKIHNYMLCRLNTKYLRGGLGLNQYESEIIMNYIENGYKLSELYYELKYKDQDEC